MKDETEQFGVRLDSKVKADFFKQTEIDNCEPGGLVRGFIQAYLEARKRGERLISPVEIKTLESETVKKTPQSTAPAGAHAAKTGAGCQGRTKRPIPEVRSA